MSSGDEIFRDRLPPQNQDAERSVLGSMLRVNSVIGDIIPLLKKDDFYTDAHQKIYQTIVEHHSINGQAVDLVILAEQLRLRGWFEDSGGYAYLASLWDAAPTAANAEYYARIVRDKALVRGLIEAGTTILSAAYNQSSPAEQLIEEAAGTVFEMASKGLGGSLTTLEEAITETYDRIDKRTTGGETSQAGLNTGFSDLTELTAGLHNGELVIIAARPSVGKTAFSLALTRNVLITEQVPVFYVSLEQSRIELAERMLCAHARVDSHRLRKGTLTADDMSKLVDAGNDLRSTQLYIDDSPQQGMLRIAANARRLKHQKNIRMMVIDYLQLIEPESRRDPRHEQVAQISRRLKFLARELNIPVIALAQVNRSSEDRQDHRPRLSDLRESGCLTGDTRIALTTGERVPIRELLHRPDATVWALNEQTLCLEPTRISNAFCTGIKPVWKMKTRLGRVIRATANHRFRVLEGWKRLDELRPGEPIAMPRQLPATQHRGLWSESEGELLGHLLGDGCTLPRHAIQYTTRELDLAEHVVGLAGEVFGASVVPRIVRERNWYQVYLAAGQPLTHNRRNSVAVWLDRLGVFGLRSWEKHLPEEAFLQPLGVAQALVRGLWATDGCIRAVRKGIRYPAVYFTSSSEALAKGLQSLLLVLGIRGRLRECRQPKGRTQFQLWLSGREELLCFAQQVGARGRYKRDALESIVASLSLSQGNPNRDTIPSSVWHLLIVPLIQKHGITMRAFQARLQTAFCGSALYKRGLSRARLERVNQALGGDPGLIALAKGDVYWDPIVSIEPDGVEEVFDLTVPGHHNFVANDVIVHNSIEQDADTVFMLHRPDRYEPGQHEGIIEVIVAKQRNGPTGEVTLAYLKQYLAYEDFKVATPFQD